MSSQPSSGKITNGLCPFKANINSLWKEQMALLCMEIFVFLLVCAAVSQKMWFLLMKQCFKGRVRCSAGESLGELIICHWCACWVFASRYVSLRRVNPKLDHSCSVIPYKEERGQLCSNWEDEGTLKGWPCLWGCSGQWEEWRCPRNPPDSCGTLNPALMRVCWGAAAGAGFGVLFLMLFGPRENVHFAFLNIQVLAASVMLEVNVCWQFGKELRLVWGNWEYIFLWMELCCRALCLQNQSAQLSCSCDTHLVTSGQE